MDLNVNWQFPVILPKIMGSISQIAGFKILEDALISQRLLQNKGVNSVIWEMFLLKAVKKAVI